MSKANGWVKCTALCLVFIVVVVAWEIVSGFVWLSQFDSIVDFEVKMSGLSTDYKSYDEIEKELREQGNPYSLFK